MEGEIVNKVANSGLITLSMEEFYPPGPRMSLDIAPWLYEGFMLREKDFRQYLAEHDWAQYAGAFVAVHCSADAIIPQWAYMLLASALQPHAAKVVFGSMADLEALLLDERISQLEVEQYRDKRLILKGCSDLPIPPQAYVALTSKLQEVVKSLMFGEACSTVPVYKKK